MTGFDAVTNRHVNPPFVVGIDVGGTFTDFVLFKPSPDGGSFTYHKEPSSPDNPALAVGIGLVSVMDKASVERDAEGVIFHGTTLALNAILQDKGAHVALITSQGNRDVLEIGRARMPSSFNFRIDKERRVVPRDKVIECTTRIGSDGAVILSASDTELDLIAKRIRDLDVPAVAVMLLNSYINKAPEVDIVRRLKERIPGVHFIASSEIWPEIREYERALVTVLNAQITPLMDGYLGRLEAQLKEAGIKAKLFISASNGGVIGLKTARLRPIDTILSGPASGVTAAVAVATNANISRIVSFDMGGTSTDISMVRNGVVEFANQTIVGDLPVILPAVEVSAIGAGGGSVIHVDDQGLLKVGPASAGAVPGPAAYGRGGDKPTITDCYVANGWIDPNNFLGGRMRLDRELAQSSLNVAALQIGRSDLANPEAVADAALRIATARMATGLTRHLAQKGEDARSFTLVPFGGAGPTHASFLANETGISSILVPGAASTFCALGGILSRVKRTYAASLGADSRSLDKGAIWPLFSQLIHDAQIWIEQEGQLLSEIDFQYSADMRYRGQAFNIEVSIPSDIFEGHQDEVVNELFHKEHERLYGFREGKGTVEAVTVRVTVSAQVCSVPIPQSAAKELSKSQPMMRNIYHNGSWEQYAIYQRSGLQVGTCIDGPAIIEQSDTTIPVLVGWSATVDHFGNLLMKREQRT